MLSANKSRLARAERIAIGGVLACCIVALLPWVHDVLPILGLPVVLGAMAVIFYLALLIAGLTAEVNRALGKWPSETGEPPPSTFGEIRRQLQWSPVGYKAGALIAVGGLVVTGIAFGPMGWTTSEPFTHRHAMGASLYCGCLLLLELPLIASAARMPGTFDENIASLGE